MNEEEREERESSDVSFDQDQQHMFGNEHQAQGATRPAFGWESDPVLPGDFMPPDEDATEPAKPADEGGHGDKF